MDVTAALASYAISTRFADLPPEGVQQGKRCLMDWLGTTLIGSTQPLAKILWDTLKIMGGEGQATVIGLGVRTTLLNTALLNGSMGHALDYDDTIHPARIHPSTPVFPAILALAEGRGLGGRELLTAFLVGMEVEGRVGLAVGPAMSATGWHPTGVVGALGAAAGAARLLGLDEEQSTHALGIAATQGAGMIESFGTMCKPFHAGKAAANGLLAALLAERGFTGPTRALEGRLGWARLYGDNADLSVAVQGLGKGTIAGMDGFKPYACGVVTHATIDAAIEIRRRYGVKPEEIEAVHCEVFPEVLHFTNIREPATGLQGKFSIYHCAAVALTDGAAGPAQFTDEKVRALGELRRRVTATSDPTLSQEQAIIRVRTKQGKEYTHKVECAKGNPPNPMTDEELEGKFRALAATVLLAAKIERIIGEVRQLEDLKDVRSLVSLCY